MWDAVFLDALIFWIVNIVIALMPLHINQSAKRALKLTLLPTFMDHTAPTLSTGSHTLSDGVTLK